MPVDSRCAAKTDGVVVMDRERRAHDEDDGVPGELPQSLSEEFPCPYLPGQQARYEVYSAPGLTGGTYERLMACGFRRSGELVYRPRCRQCTECRQIRVLVDSFRRTRSMRRVWRRNQDVTVERGAPQDDIDEKHEIYQRYLEQQHDDTMNRSREAFNSFLSGAHRDTFEFRYRLGNRLAGVSVTDRCPGGLSSVYMYFDPEFACRSLGVFSVLHELEVCRAEGLPYYYLGYLVTGSATMEYKARFRPFELLMNMQRWVRVNE